MTVRRGPLYLGVFLLAAGGVGLLLATGVLDPASVANTVLVLWPVAVIAIGVGLVLRRSPLALPAGLVAALLPGLALGGSFAAIPSVAMPCTDGDGPVRQSETRSGSFGTTGSVDLTLSCGELRVTTGPGNAWSVAAAQGENRTSTVTATGDSLVASSDRERGSRWNMRTGRVEWDVVLPTASTLDLAATVNAGRARLDLDGARLGELDVDVNAGAIEAVLTGAALDRLTLELNAGAASITLPSATFEGDLDINAGSLDLCVPDDLGIRVRATTALGSADLEGLVRVGDAWETPGYATAPFKADLAIDASLGSIDINPEGGCK